MASCTEIPSQNATTGASEPVIQNPGQRRRRYSAFDPRPGRADPDARRERKRQEQEHGFGWKPLLLVGLIGTTLWGGFNKSLSKCEQRHQEEDRQEEERKRRQERRDSSRDRDRERTRSVRDARDHRSSSRRPRWDEDDIRSSGSGPYIREPRREARGRSVRHIDERQLEPVHREREREGHRGRRPVSQVEMPRERGREYWDYYQYQYDPRLEREQQVEWHERPRGRGYREGMKRRDSSW